MGNRLSSESGDDFDPFECPCSEWLEAYGLNETPPIASPLTSRQPSPVSVRPTPLPHDKSPEPGPPENEVTSKSLDPNGKHPPPNKKEPSPGPNPDPKPSPCRQPKNVRLQMALCLLGHVGNYAPTRSFFCFEALIGLISCTCCPNRVVTAVVVAFFGFLSLLSCFTDRLPTDHGCRFAFLSFRSKSSCSCPRTCTICCCHKRKEDARVKWSDILHAFVSTAVYVLFAVSDQNVMDSLFPDLSKGRKQNLQWARLLAVFVLGAASLLWAINRKCVGFAVVGPKKRKLNDRSKKGHNRKC